jgi:hypothetical protein
MPSSPCDNNHRMTTDSLAPEQTMTSAYEHGQNAAQHGKHIQACPFDTGTVDWREWREGSCDVSNSGRL